MRVPATGPRAAPSCVGWCPMSRGWLTVHQLLGRIVYFHVLFIEPAVSRPAAGWPVSTGQNLCCNHPGPPTRPTVGELVETTAWRALDEVARALPVREGCVEDGAECCATCRTLAATACLAAVWLAVEHHAYGLAAPSPRRSRACRRVAASRVAAAFAAQHNCGCPALTAATSQRLPSRLPTADNLPLIGELLTLWADPTAADAPVASWLNHCAGLADVARIRHTRRRNP